MTAEERAELTARLEVALALVEDPRELVGDAARRGVALQELGERGTSEEDVRQRHVRRLEERGPLPPPSPRGSTRSDDACAHSSDPLTRRARRQSAAPTRCRGADRRRQTRAPACTRGPSPSAASCRRGSPRRRTRASTLARSPAHLSKPASMGLEQAADLVRAAPRRIATAGANGVTCRAARVRRRDARSAPVLERRMPHVVRTSTPRSRRASPRTAASPRGDRARAGAAARPGAPRPDLRRAMPEHARSRSPQARGRARVESP